MEGNESVTHTGVCDYTLNLRFSVRGEEGEDGWVSSEWKVERVEWVSVLCESNVCVSPNAGRCYAEKKICIAPQIKFATEKGKSKCKYTQIDLVWIEIATILLDIVCYDA